LPLSASAQEEVTFTAVDEATVYADRYAHEGDHSRGLALLFHDETGNAQQYADIVPRLTAMGFDAVAVDTRIGGNMYGGTNRTLAALPGPPTFYDDSLQDVEAAVAWARQQVPDSPLLLWGSGPSADEVIVVAADHPEGIAAVLAFSPFSMLMKSDEAEAASRLTVPLFVGYATTPVDELGTVSKITDAVPPDLLTFPTPEVGAHGVVTLTEQWNPKGWEANWAAVEAFLDKVAP
jgi:alpha-beta hydrolase superfamily lysophospholipase